MEHQTLFIAVLAFSAISVSRAEESLFVRKGGSVRLDLQGYEKQQLLTISWTFNSDRLLDFFHKIKHLETYGNHSRVEFDQKDFSLLLTNVQESDSGIYRAEILNTQETSRDVTYRLTVQEAPPTPKVGVALLSSAGGFCKVSVNCSANDTWASHTCDHAHCTQVENTTLPTGFNITVTAANGMIHCSSSNRVDTRTRSESTKHVCPVAQVKSSPGLSPCALKSVLFSLCLVAMVSAVIVC